ncbi:hypothetical protein SAMN05892877_117162 [Rhizobium subbaraonis]|uniref:Tail protein n=1 Tax=Rhizobium subbaraonis TaxID=908946 RepID=A0A285UVG7_9HYPH|nr:hypothetical protein [Rhizobium subbaraonis]SOC45773.1 hypothetical protein SAMN05892877_117162 [Rhizobium subbaraonis]
MSLHHRMMLQRYGLGITTSLYSEVVFDPIFTPLFTSIFGASFAATTAGSFLISTASFIATTAITMGIQLLMAPKPPKPEDVKIPRRQAIPYRQWAVGRVRAAGAYMLWEAKGSRLFGVQAIAGHKIKSVNRYYLHDDPIELSDLDGNGQLTFDGERYGNNVWLFHRLGEPTETAYADIVDKLGAEGVWTNNHRGDGQASVAMMAENPAADRQQRRFPHGAPSVSVEIDGAYVFDYRIDDDPSNPAAWVWSRNAALIMAWHQCFSEFGHRRSYERAILPVLDMWVEEANICDENVPLAGGGTEKRYECNGVDTTENSPKVATNAILASCDGWICERGDGALLFTVGKFRESRCGVITDADIVGHQVEYGVLPENEINRLIPKFTYPATNYTTSDVDYFDDVPAQIEAGRVLAEEADYGWCHQWRQCRRLGIRDWRREQQKVSGALDLRLSAINSVYYRWNRMETPLSLPRLDGKITENRRAVLALLSGGFNMEIKQHPENIDAWNPATDEGAQPPVPVGPDPDIVPAPVVNLIQVKEKGGTAYLRVVIVDPDEDSYTPIVRYRVADNGSGNPGAWLEQKFPEATASGGFVELATKPVPVDQPLQVQVAFEPSDGEYGAWSPTVDLVAGKQLIVNGGFSSNSAWSLGAGWTIGSGVASHTSGGTLLRQDIDLEAGATYQVNYTVTSIGAGETVRARLRGDSDNFGVDRIATGTFSEIIVAPDGAATFAISASGAVSVDNVSVRRTG